MKSMDEILPIGRTVIFRGLSAIECHMVKRQPSPFQYGKSPNPKTWQECADALKSLSPKPKQTLTDRLAMIEKALKDKK